MAYRTQPNGDKFHIGPDIRETNKFIEGIADVSTYALKTLCAYFRAVYQSSNVVIAGLEVTGSVGAQNEIFFTIGQGAAIVDDVLLSVEDDITLNIRPRANDYPTDGQFVVAIEVEKSDVIRYKPPKFQVIYVKNSDSNYVLPNPDNWDNKKSNFIIGIFGFTRDLVTQYVDTLIDNTDTYLTNTIEIKGKQYNAFKYQP